MVRASTVRAAAWMLFLLTGLAFVRGLSAEITEDETSGRKTRGVIVLPFIDYAPETGLAFGVGGIYYFQMSRDKSLLHPSNIYGTAMYTEKKQGSLELNPDFYFSHRYHLQGRLTLSDFPDKFYGIGNSTPAAAEEKYTAKYGRATVEGLQGVSKVLNLGFQYLYDRYRIVKVKEGGELAAGDIPGSKGGTASGLGPLMTYDSRNNIFFPTAGSFHQVSAAVFGRALGSRFSFTRFYFDLRRYLSLAPAHTLALQAQMTFQTGTPPFWRLALLGGSEIMRGYYLGRYRDRSMVAIQAEYRWLPVFWRLGLVAFIGAGEVAHKISSFDLSDFKPCYGFGLRFLANRTEGFTLRLDFGFGSHSSGVYLTAGEAF